MDSRRPAPAPARTSSWFGSLLGLLSIAVSIGALRNALALEPQLEPQARDAACGVAPVLPASATSATSTAPATSATSTTSATPAKAPAPAARPGKPAPLPPPPAPCRLQLTRWERGALGRTFEFEAAGTRVRVDCQREYVFVGDYACLKTL